MSNNHEHGNAPWLTHPHLSIARPKRKAVRNIMIKAAIAGLSACAVALPALAQLAGPVYVTGSAAATITVTFTAAPPSGSTVSCSLSLISSDQRGPSDTNSTTASVNGSSAVCRIQMYFRWRLSVPANDTMTIAYSVNGPSQTSSGLVNIIPMPASGTALNLNVGVTQ